ncbi:MAG: VOC family protein [Blautia sp.]|nr:VOC family protein [Blautia sp.]
MSLRGILSHAKFAQVGFVVNDIDTVKERFAALFDVAEPSADICGEYKVMQTKVFGEPAPEANCRLAFFDLTPGVQLELIEPNEAPSVWRDHLNQYGDGIHHIAFQVETGTSDQVIEQLIQEFDAVVEQRGIYGDGSGQYIYLSLQKQLKCRIELLESF